MKHRAASTDGIRSALEAFANAIDGRAPFPVTIEAALHGVSVLEAVACSIKERRSASGQLSRCCVVSPYQSNGWSLMLTITLLTSNDR